MTAISQEVRRRREQGRSAAALFGAAAVVTGTGLLLPHVQQVDEAGLVGLVAASALMCIALLVIRERIPTRVYPFLAVYAIGLVSFAVYFNGERHGGPAGGEEMYYLWVVLWAAYYLSRRVVALLVGLMLCAHAATLAAIDPGPNAMSRWISLAGLVIGATLLVSVLRTRLDRLIGELHVAAVTDPLTGLPNRRGLEAAYVRAVAGQERSGRPFALIVADLDRFKQLNDERGHRAGDDALADVADVLRREVRAIDTAARVGGDEFAVLLPDTDTAAAELVVRRLQAALDEHAYRSQWPASASLGAAVAADNASLDDVMRQADVRMYRAKRSASARYAAAG